MAERHPAINGEGCRNEGEPLAREVESCERGNARLFFVVDVEVGGGSEDGAAFDGVPVAEA